MLVTLAEEAHNAEPGRDRSKSWTLINRLALEHAVAVPKYSCSRDVVQHTAVLNDTTCPVMRPAIFAVDAVKDRAPAVRQSTPVCLTEMTP